MIKDAAPDMLQDTRRTGPEVNSETSSFTTRQRPCRLKQTELGHCEDAVVVAEEYEECSNIKDSISNSTQGKQTLM